MIDRNFYYFQKIAKSNERTTLKCQNIHSSTCSKNEKMTITKSIRNRYGACYFLDASNQWSVCLQVRKRLNASNREDYPLRFLFFSPPLFSFTRFFGNFICFFRMGEGGDGTKPCYYFYRFRDFVTIPKCSKDVSFNSFLPCTLE